MDADHTVGSIICLQITSISAGTCFRGWSTMSTTDTWGCPPIVQMSLSAEFEVDAQGRVEIRDVHVL